MGIVNCLGTGELTSGTTVFQRHLGRGGQSQRGGNKDGTSRSHPPPQPRGVPEKEEVAEEVPGFIC